MVHTAGGDAIVRLSYMELAHTEAIRWCVNTGNGILVDGALQAVGARRPTLRSGTCASPGGTASQESC